MLIAAVVAFAAMSTADAMYMGLGPMIGVPFGLSAKLWTRTGLALDAGVGYSWWQDSSVQVHGDLLFHNVQLTKSASEDGAMGLYMGLGAQVRMAGQPSEQNTRMALRMPLGLEYFFPRFPLSIYGEAVPRFNLGTTDQYFGGDAVFGFRFYWVVGSSSLS
jgi:hypothetical protein